MSVSGNLCAQIQSLLPDYVDGEIVAVADVARINAHISGCADCASELAFLRATNFVMANRFPDVHPPVNLMSRVAQATYARPTFRERVLVWLAPQPVRLSLGGAVAAGVVLAMTISITSHNRSGAERQMAADNTQSAYPVAVVHTASGESKRRAAASAPALIAEKPIVEPIKPASLAHRDESAIADVNSAIQTELRSSAPAVKSKSTLAFASSAPRVAVIKHEISAKQLRDAPLLMPLRDRMLASRGHLERTLASGSPPTDFVPPVVKATDNGVNGSDSAVPIASEASAEQHPDGRDQIPTPAQSVVSAAPSPTFKITLGGAGTAYTANSTTIQARLDHNSYDLQNGIIPIVKSDLH